jgi:hypothetical protein
MLLSLIAVLCTAGSVQALPKAVGHWPLNGDGTDISGNGYNAIAIGGDATFTEGPYGGAVQLNGAGWIDLPVAVWNDKIVASQAFTICFWYRLDTVANNVILASSAGGDSARILQSHMPWSTNRAYFDMGGRLQNNGAWQAAWAGEWGLMVYQYDPANTIKRYYHNFDLLGSSTAHTAACVAHTQFTIGNNQGHSTGAIATFDDIRIYDVILTPEEIQEVMDGVGLLSLGAHTPVPTGTILSNDVPAVTSVSWYSPLQDSDGNAIVDSNILSVDNYAVWWGIGEEPNFLTDTPTNQTATSYTPTTPITYDTTYYWRVDTTITLDANDITGEFTSVIEGSVWSFITEPSYTPVAIESFDNAITTVDLQDAPLAVVITGNSEPIYSVDFEILTADFEYPAGSDAVLSDDGPTALTTILTTSVAGTYKVKVSVTDYDDANTGPETTVTAIAEVEVYADGCQAAKDVGGWTANDYDRNGDCLVNLGDFDEFAAEWMSDTSMQLQEEYAVPPAGYAPLDIWTNRIEAEWLDPNDPNVCSAYPLTDTTGIRVGGQYPDASGGLCVNNGTNGWVVYEITVPTAAVGNDVDVYVGYARNGATGSIMFGTEAEGEEALYGTITPLANTGGWGTFSVGVGTVTFTADGPQRVKLSMGSNPVNPDWFSFDW